MKTKMLLVFLLTVLGCGLAQSGTVTKEQVEAEIDRFVEKNPDAAEVFQDQNVTQMFLSRFEDLQIYVTSIRTAVSQSDATLHGVFQLSDEYFCKNASAKTSHDMCNSDCTNFIDNSISDDADCVLFIVWSFIKDNSEFFGDELYRGAIYSLDLNLERLNNKT